MGASLRRVEEELAKRDLADVPTSRLLALASNLRAEAGREAGQLRFSTAVRHIPVEEQFENVLNWEL